MAIGPPRRATSSEDGAAHRGQRRIVAQRIALDDAELDHEVGESRRRLEQALGGKAELFCFPNGSHDARVCARVAASYRAAVTTVPGAARQGDPPHRIPRIPVDPPLDRMSWRMHRPNA